MPYKHEVAGSGPSADTICGIGEIGRHTGFKPRWGKPRAGSNPASRTVLRHSTSVVRPALTRERLVQLQLPHPYIAE